MFAAPSTSEVHGPELVPPMSLIPGAGAQAPMAVAGVEAGAEGAEQRPGKGKGGKAPGKGKGKAWAKSWSKGWSKGWNMGWEDARPPAPTVPASFPVDADARYSGVVTYYSKLRGYGFVEIAQKGVVPEDRLFVHWRDIQSGDRFPFLTKGLEVELGLTKWRAQGAATLRAKLVTLPGGGSVQVQDELDAQKKEFVGGQGLRCSGQLKFYSPALGYGYVALDPGYAVDEVPRELRVERAEVNAAGGQPPCVQAPLAVEFGIWKTSRGACKAYNVTLPGGLPLTLSALEHRTLCDASLGSFRGEVRVWNWQQGWGFVLPDASRPLPPHVLAKLELQQELSRERAANKGKESTSPPGEQLLYVRRQDLKPGVRLSRGCQVMFQVYVDDKGAGACDVQMI